MTSTTVKTTPARKAPQDRKPSKSEQIKADAPPAGAEVLRPVTDLRSGEVADATASIMELFAELGIDLADENRTEVEVENNAATLRVFGKMASTLEPYAADLDAFIALDKGPGAGTRMADLAMWFLSELGKSDSSAS